MRTRDEIITDSKKFAENLIHCTQSEYHGILFKILIQEIDEHKKEIEQLKQLLETGKVEHGVKQ